MSEVFFEKAKLIAKYEDTEETFDVLFNPSEYSINSTAQFSKESNGSQVYQLSGSTKTLSLKLYFDTYEKKEPVTKYTNNLISLIKPKKVSNKLVQPEIKFIWGGVSLTGNMKDISISYTMFLEDGTPVRANTTISIVESKAKQKEKEDRENSNANDTTGEENSENPRKAKSV